jgi:hypothetical protein
MVFANDRSSSSKGKGPIQRETSGKAGNATRGSGNRPSSYQGISMCENTQGKKRQHMSNKDDDKRCAKCGMFNHKTEHCHKGLQKKARARDERVYQPKNKGKRSGPPPPPQERRRVIEEDERAVQEDLVKDMKDELNDLRASLSSAHAIIMDSATGMRPVDPAMVMRWQDGERDIPESWETRSDTRPTPSPDCDVAEARRVVDRPPADEPTDHEWTLVACEVPLPEDEPEEPPVFQGVEREDQGEREYREKIMNLEIVHDADPLPRPMFALAGGLMSGVLAMLTPIRVPFVAGGLPWFTIRTSISSGFTSTLAPHLTTLIRWKAVQMMAIRLGVWIPAGMLVGLSAWALRQYWYKPRVTYKFDSFHEHDSTDQRPDALDSGRLKHIDPKLVWVEVTGPRADFPILPMKEKILCSAEMFTQLAIPSNYDFNTDKDLAWEKIRYAAKTMHSVNVDRRLVLGNQNVMLNSSLLAFAQFRQMHDKLGKRHFPNPLPQLAGVWSLMVTASEKSCCLLLAVSNQMPLVAVCASSILVGVYLYRSTLGVMLRGSLFRIATRLILTQLWQGLQNASQSLLRLLSPNS